MIRKRGIIVGILTLATIGLFAQNYSFEYTSDQEGLFGFFGGYVLSHLDQPINEGYTNNQRIYHTGFEGGVKVEMYRGIYFSGHSTLSYFQSGSTEFYQNGEQWQQMDIDLQSVKLVINPLVWRTYGGLFHVFAGGGMYGSYIIKQEMSQYNPEFLLNNVDELNKLDLGVHGVAGFKFWNIEVEAAVGYGFIDLAERTNANPARQRFGSISMAYMFDRVIRETKSCKDKRRLTRQDKRRRR